MRVDKSKAITPDEEFDLIREQLRNIPDFIIWEVHPNIVRTTSMRVERLRKKLQKLVASAEFIEYTS